MACQEEGVDAIIINNNPETVSTDFDISDRLYFEPLTLEDVLNVIEKEDADGVIVQFGGQTAINLAVPLEKALEGQEGQDPGHQPGHDRRGRGPQALDRADGRAGHQAARVRHRPLVR